MNQNHDTEQFAARPRIESRAFANSSHTSHAKYYAKSAKTKKHKRQQSAIEREIHIRDYETSETILIMQIAAVMQSQHAADPYSPANDRASEPVVLSLSARIDQDSRSAFAENEFLYVPD